MLRKLLEFTSMFFKKAAFANASSACAIITYQPEMPEELK